MTATQQGAPPDIDPRMQRLLTLLTIHKNARHKNDMAELSFLMVNQTFNLVPYRHGVFWRRDGDSVKIEAASGLVELDPGGPYVQWLSRVIPSQIGEAEGDQWLQIGGSPQVAEGDAKCLRVTAADCKEKEKADWSEWASSHALLVTMKGSDGKIDCGLWLDRDEAFHDTDVAFLEDLGDGYAHAIRKLMGRAKGASITKSLLRPTKSGMTLFLFALVAAMFIPVRMSATAPAEVIARNPYVVTVPFDGVIEQAMVQPNQQVRKGDVLVVMDKTALKNKSELTQRELEAAQIELDKTEREALNDPKKRMDINLLRAQIIAKETEKRFADDLLARAEIKAETDGIVIFPDVNAMKGKPARTGEQVMLLAKPDESELLIRVPVDAMIDVKPDVEAKFFLNIAPLNSRAAKIETISYQPSPDGDGLLSYKVRAQFTDGARPPRIGSTGTAKVFGETSFVLFNFLRRPVITLRHKTGL